MNCQKSLGLTGGRYIVCLSLYRSSDFQSMKIKSVWKRKNAGNLRLRNLKKLPNIKLPDINLSLPEIISLYFLKGEERLYKGTDIGKHINSAFNKIGVFAPNGLADKIDKIKTLFIPFSKFAKDYSGKERFIESLTEGMLQKKTCHVKYHSFSENEIKEFRIDPLNFFERKGGLYFFARITRFGDIRMLAVERIQTMELTNDYFEYPDDFDPEEVLSSAFDIIYDDPIEAKIWFPAAQARYIKERQWAKEQKIKEQKDGSIILEMKTSGFWDVKKWALSFGAEAEVLEPKELREAIGNEIKKVMGVYK